MYTKNQQHINDRYDLLESLKRNTKKHEGKKYGSEFPIRLNKQKKHMLEEEKNTQIDRQNRILYEKIKGVKRSLPTTPHSRIHHRHHKHNEHISPQPPKKSRRNRILTSPHEKEMILFQGHNFIDGVEFKLKISIKNCIYILVGSNNHTNLILQMPEQEYWPLHHKQFQQNPCNIFKYLQIRKGRLQFRVQTAQKKKSRKQITKLPQI